MSVYVVFPCPTCGIGMEPEEENGSFTFNCQMGHGEFHLPGIRRVIDVFPQERLSELEPGSKAYELPLPITTRSSI